VEHQVLLLRDVLQFGPSQTAAILGLERSEMEGLLAQGRRRIEAEAGAQILIIEDEGPIALDLQSIVEDMGHTVCGIAAEKSTALEIALRESPDLILSDLRLRGEDDGISTVHDILTSMDVPVIFVTAYPERMLTGNRLEPTFIIPKPYNVRALKTAIGHSLVFETVGADDT
jgi:CheY-like chemotaxis protein